MMNFNKKSLFFVVFIMFFVFLSILSLNIKNASAQISQNDTNIIEEKIPAEIKIDQPVEEIKLPEIDLFYSPTCPHCHAEIKFLEKLKEKYPDLKINKYDIGNRSNISKLKAIAEKNNVDEKKLGFVPMTFIGNRFIVGFDDDKTTGVEIEKALLEVASSGDFEDTVIIDSQNYTTINQNSILAKFGIDARNLSLPILSVVLGFFDGFNICSLGALILILSLVLTLKSRKKIILFGSIFLAITALTYSILIYAWFYIFALLSPFVVLLQTIIGLIGLLGGIYFLRQYIRFRKYGPMCEMTESEWIKKVTAKIQSVFSGHKNNWVIAGAVASFAFVVTLIEFPCSAVIPAAFAAILAEQSVSFFGQMFYLGIFILFYLLDEIIIFAIGAWTLRIVMIGKNISKHLVLIQAIVFIILGLFYVGRLLF